MNYVTLLLLVIFLVSFAALFREGLWSNTITLMNVFCAALLATSLWEPVADWFDGDSTYTYLCDFLVLWGLFCIWIAIFRGATDYLSKCQVRFKAPVNLIGSAIVSLWIGWVLVCFTTTTLHTAPLSRNFLGGSFQPTPSSRMFMGTAPDRKWLAFVQSLSRGALAASPPEGAEGEAGVNPFDPESRFILNYAERRANSERQSTIRVRRQ